jgi:4-amino-4-deoxy-L-arabinose transferase-like glycosyltransferase
MTGFVQRHPTRSLVAAIAAFLLINIALGIGTAHTLRPWVDEGWHGAPAWSLAFRGYMGTPCYVEAGLKDIDRYTYWIMPIYPVLQAAWYRIWGFGLETMRALSILCVLLGLISWTLFFRRLTDDTRGALLFMALMACDYISLTGAGSGRPDAMSFAFQAAAFAAYLYWRETNLRLAILLSQTLVVLSGLTHPNGGMLSFLGVLWLVVYFDRRRIRLAHVALAAIPYVAGAIGWGAYIAQDPQAFVAQYGYQLGARSQVLVAPWVAIRDEVVKRYMTSMGLNQHNPGSYGPHYLKAWIFFTYAVGTLGLVAVPALRRKTAIRVLLGMLFLYVCFYTFLEGTKESYYLIYLVYLLTAATVVFVRWCWDNYTRTRVLVALWLAAMFAIQTGGAVYRIHRDAYHKEYLPPVAFLRAHAKPGDLIMGSLELGFSIGFRDGFIDDQLLGIETGQWANWILVEEIYQGRFDTLQMKHPDEFVKLQARLAQYRVAYDAKFYHVLELRPDAEAR